MFNSRNKPRFHMPVLPRLPVVSTKRQPGTTRWGIVDAYSENEAGRRNCTCWNISCQRRHCRHRTWTHQGPQDASSQTHKRSRCIGAAVHVTPPNQLLAILWWTKKRPAASPMPWTIDLGLLQFRITKSDCRAQSGEVEAGSPRDCATTVRIRI
jgi:hypothetical protein